MKIPWQLALLALCAQILWTAPGACSQLAKSADAAIPASSSLDTYYAGTETLKPDELRVLALGTGMPLPRRSQVATCFLVELGNGDKFIFDIGSGSASNIGCLNIPYDFLDKIFITHLHIDHCGDLPTMWVDGWVGGRHGALKVWGPSGETPDLGTKNMVDKLKEAYKWDYVSRLGVIPSGGSAMEAHEFDYRQENQIVYQANGVEIRSWPAVHCIDGAVSYSLQWNGYKLVFGGDTFPNKWYVKYATNADLAVHECFPTMNQLVEKERLSPRSAINVATDVHTIPPAFAVVMKQIEPRMAVAYHFFNDFDTRFPMYDEIRSVYKGPLTMASDLIVWNISRQAVRVRQIVVNDNSWPPKPPTAAGQPDPKEKTQLTPFIESGRLNMDSVLTPEIDKFKKDHGMN